MMRRLVRGIRGNRLEGNLPKPFEGSRNDSKRFLIAFNCYCFMNYEAGIVYCSLIYAFRAHVPFAPIPSWSFRLIAISSLCGVTV